MRQKLQLPKALAGNLWHYRNHGRANAMHHHAELEFNLVTQGSGLYLLEHRRYEIRRGDLCWLFPAQEHVLVNTSPDFEMWVGVCKPKLVKSVATDANAATLLTQNPAGEYCRRLGQPAFTRLERLLIDVAAAHQQPGLFNAGLAYALLSAWREYEQAADVPLQDVHPAVEKVARLVRDNPDGSRLEELARQAGLSTHRLSRLFKQQTGIALVEFRNRQRVEKFLEIYGAGQRVTILDAALAAGFGSYPQFHRVFKRVTGRSPGKHRRPNKAI
ncbi:MAG: hypothetical protein RLY20_468 [Verrucomicrobiota bacterium]|jgi:AraC-like DNA-binding protein/quercetin dioxygenase-like cupin family protein